MNRPLWTAIGLSLGLAFSKVLYFVMGLLLMSATGLVMVGAWVPAVLFTVLAFVLHDGARRLVGRR